MINLSRCSAIIEWSSRRSELWNPRDSTSSIGSSQKLCVALCLLHMSVSRLMSLATEEEKSEAADAENFWHVRRILATQCWWRQDFRPRMPSVPLQICG